MSNNKDREQGTLRSYMYMLLSFLFSRSSLLAPVFTPFTHSFLSSSLSYRNFQSSHF